MAQKKSIRQLFTFLFAIGFLVQVQALEIKTDDFSIQFPVNWTCDQDVRLYVCTEGSSARQKPGVIVFQYGDAGPLDTIDQFRQKLQSPRSTKGKGGVPILSRVVSQQDKNIAGQVWFESIHFEGELPEYYTYYVATRRGDLQFLMTLTSHKSQWDSYKPLFERTIASLRLTNPMNPAAAATPTQKPQATAPIAPPPQPVVATPHSDSTISNIITRIMNLKKSTLIILGSVIIACLMILYALKVD